MSSQQPLPNPKLSLRVIALQFPVLTLLLILFVALNAPADGEPQNTLVFVGLASLVAGVVFSFVKLTPKSVGSSELELPPLMNFQTDMLISLACIELCALLGIFTSNDRNTGIWTGVAAIAASLIFVYPNVERYCRAISQK